MPYDPNQMPPLEPPLQVPTQDSAPGWQQALKLFVPALLAGMAGRNGGGVNGVLQAGGSLANGYADASQQQLENTQRQDQLHQQETDRQVAAEEHHQQLMAQDAQRAEAEKRRVDAEAAQKEEKFNALVKAAIDNQKDNPDFWGAVDSAGANKFTLPVAGRNIPLTEAFQRVGWIQGPDGKYLHKPKPPEATLPYRTEGSGGVVTEQRLPISDPRHSQPHVIQRPDPSRAASKDPKTTTVNVGRETGTGDPLVTVKHANGDSQSYTVDDLITLMDQQGLDSKRVGDLIRKPAALKELLGHD